MSEQFKTKSELLAETMRVVHDLCTCVIKCKDCKCKEIPTTDREVFKKVLGITYYD